MCDLIGLCRTEPGNEGSMRRGTGMRHSSRRVILICEECGENVSLANRLEGPVPAEYYERQ
jgi:hypothetical protein